MTRVYKYLGVSSVKKFLVISGLVFTMFLSANNFAYSSDMEKYQIISEIGTLSNNENYLQALDKCVEAIKKYPDEAELYYWSGVIRTKTGDSKAAMEDFNKAIDLNPNDSNLYVMRGISKSDSGDKEGAASDFDYALKLNPKDGSAYSMRACLKLEKGDFTGANSDLEMANQLFDEELLQEKSK